jgi:hypothetical protein
MTCENQGTEPAECTADECKRTRARSSSGHCWRDRTGVPLFLTTILLQNREEKKAFCPSVFLGREQLIRVAFEYGEAFLSTAEFNQSL